MPGVDPYAYMQQIAVNMPTLTARAQIETVLDELEYLYEVMSPELHDLADKLIAQLRAKLASAE